MGCRFSLCPFLTIKKRLNTPHKIPKLELEIYKRLYLRRLNLHHKPHNKGNKQKLQKKRCCGDEALEKTINSRGHKVKQIAQYQEQEDGQIAGNDLRNKRGGEEEKDLMENQPDTLHGVGSKEQPTEDYEVESKEGGGESAPEGHFAAKDLALRDQREPEFMESQRQSMETTPKNKAQGSSMPKSPEQHGNQQVQIGAQSALTVASE